MMVSGLGPHGRILFPELNQHKQRCFFSGSTTTTINKAPLFLCNCNGNINKKSSWMRAEAYRRVPMDTAGAYQMIDDVTGDKFIIWGGDDDDDDNDDTQHLDAAQFNLQQKQQPILRNFGRLKVPKVNALIKKRQNLGSGSVRRRERESEADGDNEPVVTKQGDGEAAGPRVVAPANLRGWSGAASGRNNAAVTQWQQPQPQQYRSRRAGVRDGEFFSRKSFKELGCSEYMIECLRNQSLSRPYHIQAIAYDPVLKGKTCIIADQSGSGKTLAYLVPVIQRLREEELEGTGKSASKSPRVVILVPTAELASQVLDNCRSISKHGVPFRSMVATGGFRQKTQLDSLKQELDVLIATPGRFTYLLQEGFVQLTNLKCVVLDEVDILYGDEEFEQVLQSLINSAPMEAQYLFVTATLPVDIYNKLVQVFPDCEVTMGPGIHRTSTRLEEVLVDCSGDGMEKNPETAFVNKKSALLKLAEESPVPKTIVFCNKIDTCRRVENALKRFDRKELHIKVLPFHAALAHDVRLTNMKEFLSSQSKDSMFLICTDRASRGIDFADVDHVVLFDFPRDPSEYVRRVGRTARGAGGTGKAFVFVVGKQVSLAKRIMDRNKKGHPLHDVPSAYELEGSIG